MISIELKGRFGNHLFQYALCRCVAEKKGYDFCIPNGKPIGDMSVSGYWLGNKLFNCPLGGNYNTQKKVFKENSNSYTPEVFDIEDGTHLNGWWQSDKYFKGYEDKIREWFSIEDSDSEYIGDNYCIIHLRAQDGYLRNGHLLPLEYFKNAKNIILKENPNIKFVIVTDNTNMAKKYFPEDILCKNDMKKDFQLIKSSKYKIISNSSFSWWAAWLGLPNSKIVVAPDRWMNHNFNRYKEDRFYPNDIKTKKFIYL